MRYLNLYAGLGGNRKHITGCEVTAVESNPEIAAVYQGLYPDDFVIVGDAHEYLRQHHMEFDFIWSSVPCQTHSRLVKATRHTKRKYPDMKLYEEVIFLEHFCASKWVVENVISFYDPLVRPSKFVGRHQFWSNFEIHAEDVRCPPDFINLSNIEGMRKLQNWLGIHYEKPIYYDGNHCPAQVLRNCVHPDIGLQVFESAINGANHTLENLPLFPLEQT